MKFLSFVFLIVLAQPAFTTEIRVLSSIKPLSLIVEAYTVDLPVVSDTLLAPEQSPHHLSLKVSQLTKLKRADIVLWVGPELEPFLSKPLKNKNSLCFSCLSGLNRLEIEHGMHGQVLDPHVWLDLDNVMRLVKALSTTLQAVLPYEKATLQAREAELLSQLAEQKARTTERMDGVRQAFITYHNSLKHYVSAYKLPEVKAIFEGTEASISAAHLVELKRYAASYSCLIADIQEVPSAKPYAQQMDLPLVVMDLMAVNKQSWWDYYDALGDAIHGCSKQK